jgi:hypothetical protein
MIKPYRRSFIYLLLLVSILIPGCIPMAGYQPSSYIDNKMATPALRYTLDGIVVDNSSENALMVQATGVGCPLFAGALNGPDCAGLDWCLNVQGPSSAAKIILVFYYYPLGPEDGPDNGTYSVYEGLSVPLEREADVARGSFQATGKFYKLVADKLVPGSPVGFESKDTKFEFRIQLESSSGPAQNRSEAAVNIFLKSNSGKKAG